MGKRINVDISDAQYKEILEQAKEEVKRELTNDALKKYLKETEWLDIVEALRLYGLGSKVEALEKKKVGDLSMNDKATLAIYWLLYDELYHTRGSLT